MHMHPLFWLGLPSIGLAALVGLAALFLIGSLVALLRWIPHHGLFVLIALGVGFVAFGFFRHHAVQIAMTDAPQRPRIETRPPNTQPPDIRPPLRPSLPAEAVTSTANSGSDNTSSTAILPENPEPTPRPAWVGQPPHLEQRDGLEVYFDTVTIGPYSTIAECDREVVPAVNRSVRAYAEGHFPRGAELTVDSQFIQTRLIQAHWRETLSTSLGPMQQLHLLLAFNGPVRTEIENRCREMIVAERLNAAAGGAAVVLLLVGGVYSLLRWGPRRRPRIFETR